MSMGVIEFLDRMGDRRIERLRIRPHRPLDVRSFIGLAFLCGYYVMVYKLASTLVPAANAPLVRDALLVLGPAVGAIVQSLFRTDARDELQAQNTGEGFRAMRVSAEATKAAAETTPAANSAGKAADKVVDAAESEASRIKGEIEP